MDKEDRLQRDINRGEQARRIMEQEIVQEAFSALEKTILMAWQTSHPSDEKGRHDAWLMMGLLADLKNHLQQAIATGKVSKKELGLNQPSKIKRILGHG